jgi:uncharacterized membrane protein YdjX (TVP38/TMEM64 family)
MTNRILSTTTVGTAAMLVLVPIRTYSWVTTPLPWSIRQNIIMPSSSQINPWRCRSGRTTFRDSHYYSRNKNNHMLEDTNVLVEERNRMYSATFFQNRTDDIADARSTHTVNQKNHLWLFYSTLPPTFSQPKSRTTRCSPIKVSSSSTSTSNFPSRALLTGQERELLLMIVLVFLVVTVGILSYGPINADSNLLPFMTLLDFSHGVSRLGSTRGILSNPGSALDRVVERVHSMGPLGVLYFGVAYTFCEILAVPAIPLTASAGYLFGPLVGTTVVLLSASIAAGISFVIGRTLLRDYVEGILQDYPKFAKLDNAIGKKGFKLMLLLRLSPIFPFALSNYLYGASSIEFPAFLGATLLGFAPGTLVYIYTGYIGNALTTDGATDVYPWYVYLGGITLCAGLFKVLADTATRIVEEIESDDNDETTS